MRKLALIDDIMAGYIKEVMDMKAPCLKYCGEDGSLNCFRSTECYKYQLWRKKYREEREKKNEMLKMQKRNAKNPNQ